VNRTSEGTRPVYAVALPEYRVKQAPDEAHLGATLDAVICTRFPDRRLAVRGIGLADHPGHTANTLVATIRALGTDRYDPTRRGVHDDFYAGYAIDLFATPCEVRDGHLISRNDPDAPSVMGQLLADFYHGALADRGYPIRLDLLLVFDRERLEEVDCSALWPCQPPEPESCAFAFRYPDHKYDALLGIIHITR
jgi:hypothetical protein